ncbi:MAG: hypothetical protein J6K48_09955 [Lachnospiraceae bacterium]|nr:hypothetical protein [Lachnospiraceae bacterium]
MKKSAALFITGMLICSITACKNKDHETAETQTTIETNASAEETSMSDDTADTFSETDDDEVAEAEAEEIDATEFID